MSATMILFAAVWGVFAPGSADNPSAVAPVTVSGEPVAFWWDERAFHVGECAFAWTEIGVKPIDGCKFKVELDDAVNREKIEINATIRNRVPRYRIGRFGQVGNTNIHTRVEVSALAKGTVKSQLSARGATQNYVLVPMSKAVVAGESAVFDIDTPICSTSGRFRYTLTGTDGEDIYTLAGGYRDPRAMFDWQYVWTDVPTTNLVVNTMGWNDDPRCVLRILAKDYVSDTVVAWARSVPVGEMWGRNELRVDVADLTPGFYWMHLDYIGGDGKIIYSDRRFPYLKPGDKMPWQGNALGAEDTVPPPWTKPEFSEDGIFRCWNREIRLGGDGLVCSVKSGGRKLLTRPSTLVFNGRPLTFDVRLATHRNSDAIYYLKAREADIDVTVKCEFDGFMSFEVAFPSSASSLVWKVAANRAYVTGFDDCSGEDNANAFFPKGKNPSIDFDPSKRQMWWLPGRIGLMGGIMNMHGWHVRNLEKAGRVTATAHEIEVATTFVDEPISGKSRRVVRFYMEPTPIKPKDLSLASTDETKWTQWTGHLMRYFESKYPGFEMPDRVKHFRDELGSGKRVFFYNASGGYGYGDPFWNWYRRDWHQYGYTTFAHEAPKYDPAARDRGWTYGCVASKDFFDFKIWGINWYFNEYIPEMKDLYFDLAVPSPCQNADHGCVWKDDFDRQVNDWQMQPMRELHKRAYRLVKAKNSDGVMFGHVSKSRGPNDAFFDMICAGEGFAWKIHQHNYNYYDIFTPEVMQSFFVPRAQELVMVVIPQFARAINCWAPHLWKSYDPQDPETNRAIRHFIAYAKIHDLLIQGGPKGRDGPQFYKVDAPIRRIRAKGVYSAYYLEGEPAVSVSKPAPRFLWAWFADGKESVLVLLNDTDSEVTQTVTVKGLSAKGRDILDGTSFDFMPGNCTMTFGPRAALFISFGSK